jgi:hypothetical protein
VSIGDPSGAFAEAATCERSASDQPICVASLELFISQTSAASEDPGMVATMGTAIVAAFESAAT